MIIIVLAIEPAANFLSIKKSGIYDCIAITAKKSYIGFKIEKFFQHLEYFIRYSPVKNHRPYLLAIEEQKPSEYKIIHQKETSFQDIDKYRTLI